MWHCENITKSYVKGVLKKIKGIESYVDVVRIWFEKNPCFDMEKLKTLCGDVKPYKGWKSWQDNKTNLRSFNYKYEYKLELLQPTRAAFLYIKKHTSCPYLINYVEVSLDYIVKTLEDVKLVRKFFDSCWVKRWKLSDRIIRVGAELYFLDPDYYAHIGTTYYEKRKSRRNYVIYSDQPSKINQELCCHLEIKFGNSDSVKREGIDSFNVFIKPGLLINLWKKHLQLRIVKAEEEISKIIFKTLRRKDKKGNRFILKNIVLKLFRIDGGIMKAQNVVTYGKWFNGRVRFLEKISNEPFLPEKDNDYILRIDKINK